MRLNNKVLLGLEYCELPENKWWWDRSKFKKLMDKYKEYLSTHPNQKVARKRLKDLQ